MSTTSYLNSGIKANRNISNLKIGDAKSNAGHYDVDDTIFSSCKYLSRKTEFINVLF